MDFDEALGYIQGRLRLGIKLGNQRFEALLARLGNPHHAFPVVHIAGTKGKGSTTAMTASILRTAGYRVGAYFSPYVYDVLERVQVDGDKISRDDFARIVTEIQPHVDALDATEHGPTTEFEMKTAIALVHFAQQKVDCAVIEVGIGGRLDATNVVPHPLATAITTIGYDHMELLGPTLTDIAREKAGIVKPGVPCVSGPAAGGEADLMISSVCAERGAPHTRVAPAFAQNTYRALPDGCVEIATPRRRVTARLSLRGAFQLANAAMAVAVLDAIDPDRLPPIDDAAVVKGLRETYLPGRFQILSDRPVVVADGAHNELAAEALAVALRQELHADERRLILVVGLTRHHEPEEFLAPLARLRPACVVATQPAFRPRPATDVAEAAFRMGLPDIREVAESVPAAMTEALALAGPDDVICLTGSFYTVGDVPPERVATLIRERK